MDSKKRQKGSATEVEDRASKRRRILDSTSSTTESIDTITKNGLALIEQIKRLSGKGGRLVATDFLSLPNRRALPGYYKFTKFPIALDTIEAKLRRKEFKTHSSLESYFLRMVQNAKDYNEEGSEIYSNAVRIGSSVRTSMTRHNPAYKTGGYVPQPAQVPGQKVVPETGDSEGDNGVGANVDADGDAEADADADADADDDMAGDDEKDSASTMRKPAKAHKDTANALTATQPRAKDAPSRSVSLADNSTFTGLSFQQAQEKLIFDLMKFKYDESDASYAFEPFLNLPARSLRDYYQAIPHPVSLRGVQKLVKGIYGRADATGVSDFKTWTALEEETSCIWRNAWHYNEDGSEISLLAKDLETRFNKMLAEAKEAAPEPSHPKLKLKMSSVPEPAPKITLRMTKGSPAAATGVNGLSTTGIKPVEPKQTISLPARNGTATTETDIAIAQPDNSRGTPGSISSPRPSSVAPVKKEESVKLSPALPATVAASSPVILPASSSGGTTTVNGSVMPPPPTVANSNPYYNSTSQPYTSQYTNHAATSGFDSKWRQPGKDISDAMISKLSLVTHPGLNISRHFRMELLPSATMAQQSITINLPSTHYYLQVKPTIAEPLLERQHKLFVTSGTQRLHGMPTIPGQPVDPRHPLFEARLLPGVNKIEIELIAALPRGATRPANGQDVELEKITVFANLLRT